MTTKSKSYPTRIPVKFSNKEGYIVLDQIRTVIKPVQFLGLVDKSTGNEGLAVLIEMFE